MKSSDTRLALEMARAGFTTEGGECGTFSGFLKAAAGVAADRVVGGYEPEFAVKLKEALIESILDGKGFHFDKGRLAMSKSAFYSKRGELLRRFMDGVSEDYRRRRG